MARSADAKSPEAFRTISEVSAWLGTPAHVLRFWESRFPQIKPVKRAGGRRYYRPADMMLLGGIKRLLHDDGITIKGVRKILREKGARYVASLSVERIEGYEPPPPPDDADEAQAPSPIDAILAATAPPGRDNAQTADIATDRGPHPAPEDAPVNDGAARDDRPAVDAPPLHRDTPPVGAGGADDSPDDEAAAAKGMVADSTPTSGPVSGPMEPISGPAFPPGDMAAISQEDAADPDARILALYRQLAALRDRVAASVGRA